VSKNNNMNTVKGLRAALRKKGTSINDFSQRNGYNYRTVCVVAQRWWHRDDREPHGGIARSILKDLKHEVNALGGNK